MMRSFAFGTRWRRRFGSACWLALLLFVCSGCQKEAGVSSARPSLRLVMVAPWIDELRKVLPDVEVTRIDQPADGMTAEALQRGTADCGLSLASRISSRTGDEPSLP